MGQVGRGQRPSGDGEEKSEDKGVHCVALGTPFTALGTASTEVVKRAVCTPTHGGPAERGPSLFTRTRRPRAWNGLGPLGEKNLPSPEACHLSDGRHGLKKRANATNHQKLLSDWLRRQTR